PTPQGECVFAILRSPGGPTIKALGEVLPALAAGLAFPKTMRWGPEAVRFARPVRWLVALLGREVVACRFADVEAGRRTFGHRVLSPRPITIPDAQGFEAALRRGYVLLDPEVRRRRITESTTRVARRAGGHPILDPDLLEETIQLVEWPEALAGRFAPAWSSTNGWGRWLRRPSGSPGWQICSGRRWRSTWRRPATWSGPHGSAKPTW